MKSLRLATADDISGFSTYRGGMPDWVVAWRGWAYEQDGEVVALGSVCFDKYGQAMCFFDAKKPIPPFVMHRTAKEALEWVRSVQPARVLSACDETRPNAAKWLRRLGFRPTEIPIPGFDTVVWEWN